MEAVEQSVPGVSMRTSGPGQTEFEMRGMASNGGDSPTVGFYLDDIALTAPAGSNNGKVVIDPNLYDLNRIEVLRGPQGTLYGSGSMGGTIKLVTNSPDLADFQTSEQVILGGTDGGGFNHGENAMVNVPFGGGTAALRIVGSESHDSGWIDRVVIANGDFPLEMNPSGVINPSGTVRGNVLAAPVATDYHGVNDSNLTGIRASILWKPIESLTITPAVLWQKITQGGLSDIDSDPGTDAHYQPFDSPEPFLDAFRVESLHGEYLTDWVNVSSTTAYWSREEQISQDAAESWQWGLALPSFYVGQGGIGPAPAIEDDKSHQRSEELRITSVGNAAFKWLVGYFYEDFGSDYNVDAPAPGAATLFGTGNLYDQIVPTKITQQALFVDLSYQLTRQLQLEAGVRRYSYNESVTTYVSGAVSPSGSNAWDYFYAPERSQGLNPKYTVSYQPTTDVLLYSTAAKGFRPGGGTGPVPTSGPLGAACEANLQVNYGTTAFVPSPISFNPDSVWSYELGEKLKALNNRLTLNSAAYLENWRGVQQNIPMPCGYNYQANAGNARVYGGEIEVDAIPLTGFNVSANAGYTHATIVTATLIDAGLPVGARVQDVPDWTGSIAVSYRRSISGQLAFTARIENDYVGTRTDSTYAINNLPSYDLTNVRAGVESGRWSAVLFAKNLFNQRALLNDMTQEVINMPTYNRVIITQPLTIGIDLSYRLGQ
jgi:outer membrane receptor protein involved in Fe transport